MFTNELEILDFCLTQEEEEIKDGILIKRVENLPCPPSSVLEAIGYDKQDHTLYVQFKTGRTRQYFNVPISVWNELIQTKNSIGKLYNALVKNHFRAIDADALV